MPYRQELSGFELSIEQGTNSVPADGYFYVILRGVKKGRFRTLAQATKLYNELKAESGYTPPERKAPDPQEIRQREMDAQSNKTLLWTAEDFARVDRMTKGRPKHGGGRG